MAFTEHNENTGKKPLKSAVTAAKSGSRSTVGGKAKSPQPAAHTRSVSPHKSANAEAERRKKSPQRSKPVRRPLTPEQKARLEARRKAKKEANRRILKRLGAVLIIFLTCYLLVSLAVVGLMYANYKHVSSDALLPVMVYRPKKNPESTREKEALLAVCTADEAGAASGRYISYTALSELTDISSIGDRTALTVVFGGSNDVVSFSAFSNSIKINGIPASLGSPVLVSGNEYYFPVELLEKYAVGVSVTTEKDTDGNLYCKVILNEYGGTVGMRNQSDNGTPSVSEPSTP